MCDTAKRRRGNVVDERKKSECDAEVAAWCANTRLAFDGAAVTTGRLVVPPTKHVVTDGVQQSFDARTGVELCRIEFPHDDGTSHEDERASPSMSEDEPQQGRRIELGIAADDELWTDGAPPPDYREDTFMRDFCNDEDL
jgi:hypothetical protein